MDERANTENLKRVYNLRLSGNTFPQIAKIMGLSETRVIFMYSQWKNELLLQETIRDVKEQRAKS